MWLVDILDRLITAGRDAAIEAGCEPPECSGISHTRPPAGCDQMWAYVDDAPAFRPNPEPCSGPIPVLLWLEWLQCWEATETDNRLVDQATRDLYECFQEWTCLVNGKFSRGNCEISLQQIQMLGHEGGCAGYRLGFLAYYWS